MHVVILADPADHSWRQRSGELQRRLVGAEVGEHVDQVAGVEGDGRRAPFDRGLERIRVVAHVGGMRGDGDSRAFGSVTAHLDLHNVRAVAREDAGAPGPRQERLAVNHGPRGPGVLLRNHRLVVGELAFDQAADEVGALHVEHHLAAIGRDGHFDRVIAVRQDPDQLGIGARRDHDGQLRTHRTRDCEGAHGDAVFVGRRQRDRLASEPREDAGENRATLVGGRRKDDLGQRLAQRTRGDRRGGCLADRGHHGKLVRVDALDGSPVATAGQPQGSILDR